MQAPETQAHETTQAPETKAPIETQAPATTAPETEAPATAASSLSIETNAPTSTAEGTQTTADTTSPATETAVTTATEKETAATTAESINKDIAVPKLSDFIITSGEGASSAVISWNAVEGASGYEIQLIETPSGGKSTSTSIPSTTKTAFQFNFGTDPMKATVRVRALKDGEKGAWAERTVYLNGMKPEETKAATTATTKATTAAAKKQETTTAKKTETGKTESPKTGDSANIPAVAGAAAAALLAGAAVQRKKK